jgi:hypothetical protein
MKTLKPMIFSMLLLFTTAGDLFGQADVAGLERYNSYRLLKLYDYIPESAMPECLLEYYESLSPEEVKAKLVIDETNRLRKLHVYAKGTSAGYFDLTIWRLNSEFLGDDAATRVEFMINGRSLTAETVPLLLNIKYRNAEKATIERHGDTVVVSVSMRLKRGIGLQHFGGPGGN